MAVDARGINGLLVLSTASIAIAQYIAKEHAEFFQETKKLVKETILPSSASFEGEERKRYYELHEWQDRVHNNEPVSLDWLIRFFLFLLPYYAIMYTGMYTCPRTTPWLQVCFKISALLVICLVGTLLVWIHIANKAKNEHAKEYMSFKTYAKTFLLTSNFHVSLDKSKKSHPP